MQTKDLDFSPQFTKALQLMESGQNCLFITGHAGTGKSTLLDHFRSTTRQKIAVLAPTGVAALNVKGQTIHSFFGFKPGTNPDDVKRFYRGKGKKGLYKSLDAIVIDEVSMVRADLLDCVDQFLRLNGKDPKLPFGGIRMIFIGDLYQLPPVVTRQEGSLFEDYYNSPYFFSAKVMDSLSLELIELDKIYRQDDKQFIEVLDKIRRNNLDEEALKILNARHEEDFSFEANADEDFYIYLCTTNKKADEINQTFLRNLTNKAHFNKAKKTGKFDSKVFPTAGELELKVGAQVMMINNDREGRWVNGSIGKITDFEKIGTKEMVIVELNDGQSVEVMPFTWEMFKFAYNPATNKLQSESVGSFTQYPLILSWAITIHKSQGKTFEKAVIDFGWGTFAHGQAYVALSRCKNLAGMVLTKPFQKKHIIMDRKISDFFSEYQFSKKPWELEGDDKLKIIEKAIKSGNLVKLKYFVSDVETRDHMINPTVVGENQVVSAFCHLLGEEVFLNLGSVLEMEVVEGIS
jgi:ATP-dependent DNA helicase PIF1